MSLGALNAVRDNLYIISDAVHTPGYDIDEICAEFIFAPLTSETRQ